MDKPFFPLIEMSDEQLLDKVTSDVDERIEEYKGRQDKNSLLELSGLLNYGAVDDPRDKQIESGMKYYRAARLAETKTKLEMDKLLARFGERLVFYGQPGGQCPVQCEGKIDGLPFYFRARYERWSLSVADKQDGDAVDAKGFYYEEPYGALFAAGYMPNEEAVRMIGKALEIYTKPK